MRLTDEIISKVRMRFEATDEVRQLRTRQQYFQKAGKFAEAMELARTLEELFTVALDGYMRKAESEAVVFSTESSDVPGKDKDEMMEKLTVMFMACDVIESAVMDMNSILHRTKPDVTITAFDDIRQLSDMAKTKLRYLRERGDLMEDLVWGEKCDNMYEMMSSKARSIIRKRRDDAGWGRNMERYGSEEKDSQGQGA